MNICFCSQEFPPETHVGGIGTYTHNMSSALASMGHNVHVITSTINKDISYLDNDVKVHRIKKRNIQPKELSQLLYSIHVARKIKKIGCDFDIVHASEYASEAFWYSLKKDSHLITRLATPLYLVERLNGKIYPGYRPFLNLMEKIQTLKSDGIFSSTKALANVVSKDWAVPSDKIKVIPNSINVERVRNIVTNHTAPDFLQNKEYLAYFGRLEERKGVHILAQALPAIFKEFEGLQMVFIGSDLGFKGNSMKDFIRQTAGAYSDRINFFDNLAQEDVFPIVKQSKLVILPSLWEAFGFVCVEAMALGRPVVASSGSGFAEIIEDNTSGFLVEPGNAGLLSGKIINVLRNEKRLHQVSQGALRRAQDFEVATVAHNLLDYYQKIINH